MTNWSLRSDLIEYISYCQHEVSLTKLTYVNEEPSVELIDTVFVKQEYTPINLVVRHY